MLNEQTYTAVQPELHPYAAVLLFSLVQTRPAFRFSAQGDPPFPSTTPLALHTLLRV